MKTFALFFAAVIILLVSVRPVDAQSIWKADRAHSQVKFSVTHMLISEVTGNFKDFDASLTQPGKNDFAGSSLTATIKTASINTDNEKRDQHLRSDDFFKTDSFPTINFTSTSFEKTGTDTYTIKGNLTIRGVTKPVALDGRMTGMIDAWGGTHAGFKATTTIDRFDYGVKWDKTIESGGLIVGKKVDVTLLFEMVKQQEEAKK